MADNPTLVHVYGNFNFDGIHEVEPVDPSQLVDDDMVILVMGLTGAGKSTFIHTVVAGHYESNNVQDSLIPDAATNAVALRILFRDAAKRNLVLVDTPGLDDAYGTSTYNAMGAVVEWLHSAGLKCSSTVPASDHYSWLRTKNSRTTKVSAMRRISGIIFLHRITDTRVSKSVLKRFQILCGDDMLSRVMLTTTMWPDKKDSSYNQRDEKDCELREEKLIEDYWTEMIASGSKVCRFIQTRKSAEEIVNQLTDVEQSLLPLRSLGLGHICNVEEIHAQDITDDDIVIVIMGQTGVGKSTIIQTLVGPQYTRNQTRLQLQQSSANEINALRVVFQDHHGLTNLILIDTPGYDNVYRTEYQVLETIVNWFRPETLKAVVRKRNAAEKISGIVYLHRITDIRLFCIPLTHSSLLIDLCGHDFANRIVFTTTMWPDENNPAYSDELKVEYEQRHQELMDSHWKEMADSGASVFRFDKTLLSAVEIIRPLVATKRQSHRSVVDGGGTGEEGAILQVNIEDPDWEAFVEKWKC
ncbi:hypothetical protein NP233_g13026 [Leucocoprinus birnbaumii]|uniref:Septin-type G domain-containing protein n=1 Tax=Leucocoprinus birnbaumii TaxID=56174 RepID=A0AAD5VHK5_9AGAR|nr:hypothetical protein NP233_g13026 [Leucocoprinus birnbaumii]